MATYLKDPHANLDYQWDWSSWLPAGDTIVAHEITVTGSVVLGTHSHTDDSVTAWISGGVEGEKARVTARVTTTQGRVDDRTIVLDVRSR